MAKTLPRGNPPRDDARHGQEWSSEVHLHLTHGGHWIIGAAGEENDLMATGEGSTFAEAWEVNKFDITCGLNSPPDLHSRQRRRPGAL